MSVVDCGAASPRYMIFTLCSQCQALGQALVLCHQGRGGKWLVLSCVALPCGYCLKASMTVRRATRPVDSRLRGNDGEVCWE